MDEKRGMKSIEVLLVEDNPDHVELILKVLQENNILNEVHVVSDGELIEPGVPIVVTRVDGNRIVVRRHRVSTERG